MKKLLLIAVLIAACLSATAYVACVAAPLLGKNIKGSGKIVAKTCLLYTSPSPRDRG